MSYTGYLEVKSSVSTTVVDHLKPPEQTIVFN